MTGQGRFLRVVATGVACSVLLLACGNDDADTSEPPNETPPTSAEPPGTISTGTGDSAAGAALARERTEALFAGTYNDPPSESPPPASDKDVWVISYLEAYSGAAQISAAAVEATTALGWTSNIFDAGGDPSQAVNGIRQAIAAQADAVLIVFFDCESVKAGVTDAQAAGLLVINIEAADCQSPLVDHVTGYSPGFYDWNDGSFENFLAAWQAIGADYIVAQTDGDAKIVQFRQTDVAVAMIQADGFERELIEVCPDTCELINVDWVGTELGPALQQKAEQAFLQHPDVDAIVVPSDATLTTGVYAALVATGRGDEVVISGGEGTPEVLDIVRERPAGTHAVNGLPVRWDAFAAVDALNRLFNGEEPVEDTGEGLQLVDRDHNLPPAGAGFVPLKDGEPIDFASLYIAAWTDGA